MHSLSETEEILSKRKQLISDIGYMSMQMKHSIQPQYIEIYKSIATFLKTQENIFILAKGTGSFIGEFIANKFN